MPSYESYYTGQRVSIEPEAVSDVKAHVEEFNAIAQHFQPSFLSDGNCSDIYFNDGREPLKVLGEVSIIRKELGLTP